MCQNSMPSGVGRSLWAKISGERGRPWGIFFGFYKTRDTFCYPTVQTAPCYVPSFWHNTGVWRTDRQTDGIAVASTALAMRALRRAVKNVHHYRDMTLTFSCYGSLDCDERHVTALWPINRARRSWSRDNIQMTHNSECNITHVNNAISPEFTKCKCNIKTHVRRRHTCTYQHDKKTPTRAATELIAEIRCRLSDFTAGEYKRDFVYCLLLIVLLLL